MGMSTERRKQGKEKQGMADGLKGGGNEGPMEMKGDSQVVVLKRKNKGSGWRRSLRGRWCLRVWLWLFFKVFFVYKHIKIIFFYF